MIRTPAVVLFVVFLASCRHDPQQEAEIQAHATGEGPVFTLHPSEISFRVPQQWLEWNNQFHNNFHLSHNDLATVENGAGEWDTEYARVVNAILPFSHCVAHIGGEGWGREGSSFADVQMRAYITTMDKKDVLRRIHGGGLSAAREVSKASPFDKSLGELAPTVNLTEQQEGNWQKSVVEYPLWYGDYGGTGRVRFYTTAIGNNTLLLVFMGGDEREVKSILGSVSIPRK
jgi:hypothetical protein